MSAPNPLDVSLDSLIANKPKPERKPKEAPFKKSAGRGVGAKPNLRQPRPQDFKPLGGGGGGGRGGGGPPLQFHSNSGAGNGGVIGDVEILKRLGGNSASVTISNLLPTILPSDISELCLTIGEVKNVNFHYDSMGRSTGKADVVFVKFADAKVTSNRTEQAQEAQPLTICCLPWVKFL